MKVVAIIPSRFSSTRFEGKPLARIGGKSMVQRVYERAKQSKKITDVFVATDDQRIIDAVLDFDGHALMTSSENKSGTDRVAEAAEKIGLGADDIVVNIQGDQPLLDPRSIDELIGAFNAGSGFEMATLAFRTFDENEINNPKDVKVTFDFEGFALYFSRSPIPFHRDPDVRPMFYKHLGIYAYKKRFLEIFQSLPEGKLENLEKLEQLRAIEFGHRIKVIITKYDSPEVDFPNDIARIEKALNRCSPL
ncbi:MAG: 3-deoxy-manno-octulosonate cytidylyltransferase [Desulfobacterales bacterium]